MGVAVLIHGPDTGHLSEYGGRDDEDVAPREHDAAILKKNLRENFEEAKFETGKLRNHYPPPLCRVVDSCFFIRHPSSKVLGTASSALEDCYG